MADNSEITLQDLVNQQKVNHQNPGLLIQTQLDVLTDALSIYIAQGNGATPREVARELRKRMVSEFLQRILTSEEAGVSTFMPSDFPEETA